jgi:hypothetical protein
LNRYTLTLEVSAVATTAMSSCKTQIMLAFRIMYYVLIEAYDYFINSHFASADERIYWMIPFLKVNNIYCKALQRYECHHVLFNYPGEGIYLLQRSHINDHIQDIPTLLIHLKFDIKFVLIIDMIKFSQTKMVLLNYSKENDKVVSEKLSTIDRVHRI